jgi:hemolysin III
VTALTVSGRAAGTVRAMAGTAAIPEPAKPRLRGVIHQYAFFVAAVLGGLMVALAPAGKPRLAAAIYALSVAGLLGTSALYHRRDWPDRARMWMRRLDHSMIFVLIAGTYTPFALLVLHGTLANTLLIVVWAGAVGGTVLNLFWVRAPKPVTAAVYIALGWVAVAAMPQMADEMGAIGVGLIAFGGVLYTAGAVIYALRKPNPVPGVFGYHEVFHALVVAAAAAHFAAVAAYALPR